MLIEGDRQDEKRNSKLSRRGGRGGIAYILSKRVARSAIKAAKVSVDTMESIPDCIISYNG